MKKLISLALISGLVVGTFAVDASAARKRKPKKVTKTVTLEYTGGEIGITTPVYSVAGCLTDPSMPFACKAIMSPGAKFKYLKLQITDASGQKVGGFIAHDGVDEDGDGFDDGYGNFCGGHPKPIALTRPGMPVSLSLTMGFCSDNTPSIVTQGTVKAIFTNIP